MLGSNVGNSLRRHQGQEKKRNLAAVRVHKKGYSVVRVCRVIGIPKSTYYKAKEPTPAKRKDEQIVREIEKIQEKFFYTIGRRRMGVLLEKYSGIKLCETALQRIMSKYGLSARIRQNRKASRVQAE